MARRVWAWTILLSALLFCAGPYAAAQEEAPPAGLRVVIPVAGMSARLDNVGSGKTVDLLALADGGFTLSLMPLRGGAGSWVRALLSKGDSYFGLCLLGTREEFAALESVILHVDFLPQGASLRFSAQPGDRQLAALELPLNLSGECRLLPVAQTQGLTVTPIEAAPPAQETETQPVGAVPTQTDEEPPLRLPQRTYAIALLVTTFVLAALVLANMHWRRITALALLMKDYAAALRAGIYTRMNQFRYRERKPPRVRTARKPRELSDAQEEKPFLPGLRIVEPRTDTLVREFTMRTAWETAAEAPAIDVAAQMNAYFLGNEPFPEGRRFLTVGLRNRDALQQLGGGSVRPLFAPNPRGQIFSLEEESGGLYLHAECFAPPGFVLQQVLRSVCLECVFALEDRQGDPVRLEYVLGHSIVGIEPAHTLRTEAGFIVTEKGRLVIGEN